MTTRDEALEQAKDLIEKQNAILKRLGESARVMALVLEVDGPDAVITTGSGSVRVLRGEFKLTPGMQVACMQDTMQILACFPASMLGGQVGVLTGYRAGSMSDRHIKNLFLANVEGQERIVVYPDCQHSSVKGHRVILDPLGQVVLADLGPPEAAKPPPERGTHWDDIGGLELAKLELIEAVETCYTHRELYKEFGKKPVKGILLYGPPGCGKTMLGKAVATSLSKRNGQACKGGFIYIKGPEILDKYVGESEKRIREIFETARKYEGEHGIPAVIFIDEADAILHQRGASGKSFMSGTIVPAFLSEWDGLDSQETMVLLATNRANDLDEAIMREGRIDRKISVPRPQETQVIEIFGLNLKSVLCYDNPERLANDGATAIFADSGLKPRVSGALVANVVDRAATAALRAHIGKSRAPKGIVSDDVLAAVHEVSREYRELKPDSTSNKQLQGAFPYGAATASQNTKTSGAKAQNPLA